MTLRQKDFVVTLLVIFFTSIVFMGIFMFVYYDLNYLKRENSFCYQSCVLERPEQGEVPAYSRPDFFYFSVVTWNSLGYGDFTPACTRTRCVAALESLMGAFSYVILVAFAAIQLSHENAQFFKEQK